MVGRGRGTQGARERKKGKEERGMKSEGGGGGICQQATLKVVMTLIAAAFVRITGRPPHCSYRLSRFHTHTHIYSYTFMFAGMRSGTCKRKPKHLTESDTFTYTHSQTHTQSHVHTRPNEQLGAVRSCVFPLLIRAYSNINSGKSHHCVCVCVCVKMAYPLSHLLPLFLLPSPSSSCFAF